MQKISKNLEKRCGIYMIINTVNNHRYIGSSKNIYKRLQQHRAHLRSNCHANSHLQNAWNKYGGGKFIYSVLEFCSENSRIKREQKYVDTLNPEYNISRDIVNLPSYSQESKLKHSRTRKLRIANGQIRKTHCSPIFVYTLQGDFVQRFDSQADAIRVLRLSRSSVRRAINGEQARVGKYQIFRTEQASPPKYQKKKKTMSMVWKAVIVKNDEEYYEFPNAEECAKYFNVHPVYIRDAIKNKRAFKRKYMISYKSAVS